MIYSFDQNPTKNNDIKLILLIGIPRKFSSKILKEEISFKQTFFYR